MHNARTHGTTKEPGQREMYTDRQIKRERRSFLVAARREKKSANGKHYTPKNMIIYVKTGRRPDARFRGM